MDNTLIGNQIAKFRKAKNLTQEDLGRSVGVSTQAVSRWECGGAPDNTLLPAIADRLGVTVDALFGREGTEGIDMNRIVLNWFASMPEDQIYTTLHKLMFTAVMSHAPLSFPDVYLESCIEKSTGSLILSNIETDHGVYFGVNAEDMGWAAVCPRPEKGYKAFFGDTERYRSLYAALAVPGNLEIILFLLGQKQQYATAELLAKRLGMDTEALKSALVQLEQFHIICSLEIDTMEGTTTAYAINASAAFIPFFYLTRSMTENAQSSYVDLHGRTKPLL